MNIGTQFYINSFAAIILIFILIDYKRKLKSVGLDEKIFLLLTLSVLAVLFTDGFQMTFAGKPGHALNIQLTIINLIDFVFTLIVTLFWLYYIAARINFHQKITGRLKYIIPAPIVLFSIFLVLTISKGYVFSISAQNEYVRGPLFYAGIGLGYLYILAAVIIVLIKSKTLNHSELFLYLLFPIMPALFFLLERFVLLYVHLSWPLCALVLLEIQMHVLNRKTNLDYLTNLNNRMAFDEYIKRVISESITSKRPFGLIVIDIDDFKNVNDKYGHTEGDKALQATAGILCRAFTGKNFLSRYGGDEFAVVINDCEHDLLDYFLSKLEKERVKQNETSNKPYNISFSIGAYIFKDDEVGDAHSVFMLVDNLMYNNKKSKK